MYRNLVKPLFDILVSFVVLVILFPFLIILGVAIKFDSVGPIIFVQERFGENKKKFSLYKFRSMINQKHKVTHAEEKDPRLTSLGCFIRKYHLDELPQLFNVITGKMSIVGPRPMLQAHIDRFGTIPEKRFQVKPGLTGFAQINGGTSINWDEKWEYDEKYVDQLNIWTDLKIILKTIHYFFIK